MLCEEGVLDALGDSSQLSLTSKRALARVNTATRLNINKYLCRDHLWVHQSDRTIANARWLIRVAEANPELCIHVFDAPGFESKDDAHKPTGHMGFCVAMSKKEQEDPLTGLPSGAVFVASQTDRETQHVAGAAVQAPSHAESSEVEEEEDDDEEELKNAAILDETVAWFLGHMLASLARKDVGIRTTNGATINISELAVVPRLYPTLTNFIRQGLKATDWAFMDGALFHNALFRASHIGDGRPVPERGGIKGNARILRLLKLRLNDDAMTYVGAKMRSSAHVCNHLTVLDFHGNQFGALGTAAIFCTRPNTNCPNFFNRPNVLYKSLLRLVFDFTPIGNGYGMQWLISAMATHMLPQLSCLRLVGTGMDSGNAYRLFDALGVDGGASRLTNLNVSNNPFYGCAFEPMAKPEWAHPNLNSLKVCFVKNVSAQGYAFLARAIMQDKLPCIRDVISVGSGDATHCVGAAMSAHRALRAAKEAIERAETPLSPPRRKPVAKFSSKKPPHTPLDASTDSDSASDGDALPAPPAGIHLQQDDSPAQDNTSSEEEESDSGDDDDDEDDDDDSDFD